VWGTGRRAREANVTEGLGVDPPSTPADAWGVAGWTCSGESAR
jgi:hypothetical protein